MNVKEIVTNLIVVVVGVLIAFVVAKKMKVGVPASYDWESEE